MLSIGKNPKLCLTGHLTGLFQLTRNGNDMAHCWFRLKQEFLPWEYTWKLQISLQADKSSNVVSLTLDWVWCQNSWLQFSAPSGHPAWRSSIPQVTGGGSITYFISLGICGWVTPDCGCCARSQTECALREEAILLALHRAVWKPPRGKWKSSTEERVWAQTSSQMQGGFFH